MVLALHFKDAVDDHRIIKWYVEKKKKKSILNTQGSQLSMWMQIDRHHFACSLNLFQSDVHTGIFSKCGMSIIVNKNQHLKGGLFILLYDA